MSQKPYRGDFHGGWIEYDPFGNIIYKTGSYAEENPFRFSTKYTDDETDLVYYGYRYYSASLGRWINRDPSEEKGGINLYVFVNNGPINLIDPSGLWIYYGYCRYISGGEGVGVGQIRCRVWTECRADSSRELGELVAMFAGATAGIPAGVTYFNIRQDSRGFDGGKPSLDELTGASYIVSVSSALGIGSSITSLKLGKTFGEYPADSYQAGIDASVDALGGYSWLEWSEEECCN